MFAFWEATFAAKQKLKKHYLYPLDHRKVVLGITNDMGPISITIGILNPVQKPRMTINIFPY